MCVCECLKARKGREMNILCKKGKIGSLMYKIDIERERENIRTSVNK